ncbi:hypothetical protein [Belnapia rosea]|uniref:hypothetical protein n=1 Tax=Belnapia rosea TaxID=938405 RepID=UPI0008843FB6|nr:hypothetical protein [Belnapia rosea]SDB15267.1 hypothetical protein SAMN02927895_00522 [Belnapia rosea]
MDDQASVARPDLPWVTLEHFLRAVATDHYAESEELSAATLRLILRDYRDQARRFLGTEARHHVYVHRDPGTCEVLYVGRSHTMTRRTNFSSRSVSHRARMQAIRAAGWPMKEVVQVVADGLTYDQATRFERLITHALRPRFNTIGNPDFGIWNKK